MKKANIKVTACNLGTNAFIVTIDDESVEIPFEILRDQGVIISWATLAYERTVPAWVRSPAGQKYLAERTSKGLKEG